MAGVHGNRTHRALASNTPSALKTEHNTSHDPLPTAAHYNVYSTHRAPDNLATAASVVCAAFSPKRKSSSL